MSMTDVPQKGPGSTRYSLVTLILCIVMVVFGIVFLIVGLVQANQTVAILAGIILAFGIILLLFAITLMRRIKARIAFEAESRMPYEK